MKELKERLLSGDPVLREGELDEADARAIHHSILLAVRTRPVTTSYRWLRPLVVAGPRQMQFASPGGTRIIWTFHHDLDL